MALITMTIAVALRISLLLFENSAIKEMNRTAADEINTPRKGTVSACKIPPKADSLKAHIAVIREIFSSFSIFSNETISVL